MHNRILYALFFLLFTFISFGQQNVEQKWLLTLAPLSLADPYDGASLRPGLEMTTGKRTSVAIETGVYLPYLNSTKIRPHGYLIKPSFRYYLDSDHKFLGRYIAVEYMYKDQDYDFKDSLEFETGRFEKRYAIKRKVHTVSFRYGRAKKMGDNFIFDYYIGIGIRYLNSSSDLSAVESDAILTGAEGDCPIQQDILRITGRRFFPNFLLGVRLAYRL